MKKLPYLFAMLFMFAAMVSCNKDKTDDSELAELKKANLEASAVNVPSEPVSYGPDGLATGTDGIMPQIIPGANRGGNRTCAEVVTAFTTTDPPFTPHFVDCGDKLDYGDFDQDGDYEFSGAFPEWLDVTVTDGKFVAFTVTNSGENCYKVGAVIVKGSNAANVYYYPDGTTGDSGLASPYNASGASAGLSNLTFCFVECEKVISVKTLYQISDGVYAVSSIEGSYPFTTATGYCRYLGINSFEPSSIPLLDCDTRDVVGSVIITFKESDNAYEVKVDLDDDDLQLLTTHVYVGNPIGISGTDCPNYNGWPWYANYISNTHTFIIPN